MLQCWNRGCGQTYDPEKNTEESCRYHPGAPYFHDAYKSWSCCKKKSVDFTEFLNIKGCTVSKHSNVKPPEPEKPKDLSEKDEIIEVRAPIKESMVRPPVDTAMTTIASTVAPALKETIDDLKVDAVQSKTVLADGEVAIGTACKNNGCTYTYKETASDEAECVYHPGVPIFHEGMKYWSCCQKKTSDFAVFMAQKGCAYGQHKWFKENADKQVVQCRYDWHQTTANIIVSIYAKKYHYAKSYVKVNPVRLLVNLVFPEEQNATFDLDLELRGVINVAETSAHMYGSKIEITMAKAEPGSWQKLNFPRDKLPPPKNSANSKIKDDKTKSADDSDDDFNLDDIESVNTFRLAEIKSDNKNNLD